MCLNENNSKVCVAENVSVTFLIQNGLKEGDVLSPFLFNFALDYAIRMIQKIRKD
jgi:hypothetical protein